MATPRSEKPEKQRRKKKQPKKFRLSYSVLLLLAMVIVGSVAGFVTYGFGRQALEGVNPSPAGIKIPKINPNPKTQESPKASPNSLPKGDAEKKSSFFLNESELVAEAKTKSQLELGTLTRPIFRPTPNVSDRKRIYTKVDQAFNSMRDPLAVSASADQRIVEKIAALRQKVYPNGRANGRSVDASAVSSDSGQWQDRETPIGVVPTKVETIDLRSKPDSSSDAVNTSVSRNEVNRR